MERENYNITDYSIFEEAAATNNAMVDNIGDYADKIITNTDALYDVNIFDGPIANICQEEVLKIGKELITMGDKFAPISSTLETFSQNYQQADKEASNIVSSVGQ